MSVVWYLGDGVWDLSGNFLCLFFSSLSIRCRDVTNASAVTSCDMTSHHDITSHTRLLWHDVTSRDSTTHRNTRSHHDMTSQTRLLWHHPIHLAVCTMVHQMETLDSTSYTGKLTMWHSHTIALLLWGFPQTYRPKHGGCSTGIASIVVNCRSWQWQ